MKSTLTNNSLAIIDLIREYLIEHDAAMAELQSLPQKFDRVIKDRIGNFPTFKQCCTVQNEIQFHGYPSLQPNWIKSLAKSYHEVCTEIHTARMAATQYTTDQLKELTELVKLFASKLSYVEIGKRYAQIVNDKVIQPQLAAMQLPKTIPTIVRGKRKDVTAPWYNDITECVYNTIRENITPLFGTKLDLNQVINKLEYVIKEREKDVKTQSEMSDVKDCYAIAAKLTEFFACENNANLMQAMIPLFASDEMRPLTRDELDYQIRITERVLTSGMKGATIDIDDNICECSSYTVGERRCECGNRRIAYSIRITKIANEWFILQDIEAY